MKYLITVFILLYLSVVSVNAQTLSNIDFFAEGKKVIVTYDLSDCEPGEFYDVTLNFVEQSTLKVTVPKTISGDVRKITCGTKRIVWDIGADVSTLSGRFYPEMEVKKVDNSNRFYPEMEVKKADNSNVSDIDGNTYKTVQIGTQFWMGENLKTSKYNDGTTIPNIADNTQWANLTTGAWVYYNNDAANNAKYGKLYNWYAVSPTTNGNKNVCPKGWHVPTHVEWTVLTDYLGGKSDAGGKMKEVGIANWKEPNKDASNMSLFTGLPGGYRHDSGYYGNIGYDGSWWSSSDGYEKSAHYRKLGKDYGSVGGWEYITPKKYGFSLRCLKD